MRQKRSYLKISCPNSREVFGLHLDESLSLLLVEVAMAPPLPLQQAITCAAMPQSGSRAVAIARQRWWRQQRGSNVQLGIAVAASSLAAQRRRQAWQCGGASLCHQDMAAPAATNAMLPPRATVMAMKTPAAGGNSNGGGTKNQQSTKST